MIFHKDLAEKVLRGEKTATRRRMSDNPNSPWYRGGCRYKVGQVFAVQPGRGKTRIGEARVTAVFAGRLGGVNSGDAREEGFDSLLAFREAWARINGSYDTAEFVWVIEFELVEVLRGDGR